jgi:hypothetical protein
MKKNESPAAVSSLDFSALSNKSLENLQKNTKFSLHPQEEYTCLKIRLKECDDIETNSKIQHECKNGILGIIKDTCPEKYTEFENKYPDMLLNKNKDAFIEAADNVLADRLKTEDEIKNIILGEIEKMFNDGVYKSPADYMRRLVIRRMMKISPELLPSGKSETDIFNDRRNYPTEFLIIKQFIKQFGWCEGVFQDENHKERKYECEDLKKYIDTRNGDWDKAAEELTLSDVAALKIKETADNRLILRIAKEFGVGFFSSKGRTREYLYVFAIAFEMQYKTKDASADIEQNLFYDFYADSLIYYLTAGGKEEKYISGYGINIKSFLDVSFLYTIEHREIDIGSDRTYALARLIRAMRMIEHCRKNGKSEEELENTEVEASAKKYIYDEHTSVYTDKFKEIAKKDEAEALKDITADYVCKFKETRDECKVAFPCTAEEKYESLSIKIIRYASNIHNRVTVASDKDDFEKKSCPKLEEINPALIKNTEFKRLLKKFSEKIITAENKMFEDSREGNFAYPDDTEKEESICRRSHLMCVNARSVLIFGFGWNGVSKESRKSFGDFCSLCEKEFDSTLRDCGFMPVSSKNIIDLLIIYSAYLSFLKRRKG